MYPDILVFLGSLYPGYSVPTVGAPGAIPGTSGAGGVSYSFLNSGNYRQPVLLVPGVLSNLTQHCAYNIAYFGGRVPTVAWITGYHRQSVSLVLGFLSNLTQYSRYQIGRFEGGLPEVLWNTGLLWLSIPGVT